MTKDKKENTPDENTEAAPISDAAATAELGPEELQARRDAVLGQKQYVTGRVSETCRYIGFGLVAVYYTLALSGEEFATVLIDRHELLVRIFGAMGALAILADYTQYLAGARAADRALSRANEGPNSFRYNKKWLSYKIRSASYVAKQIFAFFGAFLLAYMMVRQIF